MKKKALHKVILISAILFLFIIIGCMIQEESTANFAHKSSEPSLTHWFGTDHLGRDVFLRTVTGLSTSLIIGLLASLLSACIALAVGVVAGIFPKGVDTTIGFIIDLVLSIPHLMLLILISFAVGRGLQGVVIGLICSHWTSLARIIRGEVLSLKQEPYIQVSKKLGKSSLFIVKSHILPHVIPQFIIGTVILFPHAILHEAAITFLGFGLSPESSAIGVLLSESLRYIQAGMWWLVLPGICLVVVVLLFDSLGKNCKILLSTDMHLGLK